MRSCCLRVKSGIDSSHSRKQEGPVGTEAVESVFLYCKNPSNQDRVRISAPALQPLHTAAGSGRLGWDFARGRGRRRRAWRHDLSLILSCEVEILRGRAILEVKSSLPFSY